MDCIELDLIHKEIERLNDKSAGDSLTIEDLRKLEILLKSRLIVLSGSNGFVPPDHTNFSDEDVLEALSEIPETPTEEAKTPNVGKSKSKTK